jgi:hypothetical protein
MQKRNAGKNSKKKVIRDLSKLSELKEAILGPKSDKLTLAKVAKEFNVGTKTIVEFLRIDGRRISHHPMEIISDNEYIKISKTYELEKIAKEEAKKIRTGSRPKKENLKIDDKKKTESQSKVITFEKSIKAIEDPPLKAKRPRIKGRTGPNSTSSPEPNKPIVSNITISPKVDDSSDSNIHVLKPKLFVKDISNKYIGLTFFFNFEQYRVVLTKHNSIGIAKLNFPNKITTFKQPMSWRVKVVHYSMDHRKLTVDIISYHRGQQEFSQDQIIAQNFLNNIKSLVFRNIDKTAFLQSALGHQTADVVSTNKLYSSSGNVNNLYQDLTDGKALKEKFTIDFKDLKFGVGKVLFKKKLSLTGKLEELSIVNYHIREEFNSIKDYFQKVLAIKEIKVEVTLKSQKNILSSTLLIVLSPEIDRINENLISVVKIGIIKKMMKNQSSSNLSFTIDKMFEVVNDKIKSSTFYNEESQFLDDVLTIKITKHDNHLKYLASKQSLLQKLQFFIKPFSFIFLLDGVEKNYVVWETLDTSEATYIWDIENNTISLQENFKRIESIILSIKNGGKQKYIESTKDSFERIFHNYSESRYGFSSWKLQLDSIIK